MKITFIIPPAVAGNKIPERVFGCTYTRYPIPNIFILTYAAILREAGHEVGVLDAPVISMNSQGFKNFLLNDPNDCYIFYSVNLSMESDRDALMLIREIKGAIPVLFAGPSPTYYPSYFLFDPNCYSIRGEGDWTIRDLIAYLDGRSGQPLHSIKGITYLDHKSVVVSTPSPDLIADLDRLPFPARDLIPKDLYFNPKLGRGPFTIMLTSRGCPFRCRFCVPCALNFARRLEYNRKNRRQDRIPRVSLRSAKRVIEEFNIIKQEGYRSVSIIDDEFIMDKKRVMEICERIKGLGISWGCLARCDSLTDENLIQAMAEAGCQYIDIGVESFDQKILDDIKKDMKVETIYQAIKLLKKSKIQSKVNILFGASSLETEETMAKTIREVERLKLDMVMFNICTPFPGTEFYEDAKKAGWFINGEYHPVDVQKRTIIEYPHLKREVIERYIKKANYKVYLRPRFILKNIIRFRRLNDLLETLKGIYRKLKKE